MVWAAAGLAALIFGTGLGHPLAMQDRMLAIDLPAVTQFPLATFGHFYHGAYTPLTWTGYAVAHLLGKDQAFWYHLLSAALHAANAALVFRLFRRLENDATVAFLIAVFFAMHPLQVEAVSWIAAFRTPLSALFSLLALNAYVQHTTTAERGRPYWMALGWMALACLAAPAAAVLPLSLLALDLWLKRPATTGAALLEKAPFFALALAFGALALYARASQAADYTGPDLSLAERTLVVFHSLALYWAKIIAPFGLSIWYPAAKGAGDAWHWSYFAAPAVVVAAVGLAWRYRTQAPFVWRGLLFYLANIAALLPFLPGTAEPRADHYNYLACLGIFAILAGLPNFLRDRKPTWVGPYWAALAGLALIWLLTAFARVRDWRDMLVLVEQALEHQGDNFGRAYLYRGMALGDKGEGRKALEDFNKAIGINPRLTEVYKYRGGLLGFAKQYDRSVADFDAYLEKYPGDPEVHYNRALSLVNLKRLDEALADLNKTLELDANFARAYRARGNVRKELGDTTGGDADLREWEQREQKK